MKHLFLNKEFSLLAKEKGWKSTIRDIRDENNIYAGWYFGDMSGDVHTEWITERGLGEMRIGAPLYQQIIDWFLKTHNIFIEILIFDKGFLEKDKFCFQWRIYNNSEEWFTNTTEYKLPNEALDKAIEEAFKLI